MPACGWHVPAWPAAYDTADTADKSAAEALAALTLWALSGRVFGVCEETLSPRVAPARPATYIGPTRPVPTAWTAWFGPVTCECAGSCRCAVARKRVALAGPVQSVTSVSLDGVVLDAAAYEVHNARWLVRTDGQLWPIHGKPADFEVTFMRGLPIPASALIILVDLAVEFLKARTGSGKCAIPARAQQVSRQGMDIQLIDPATLFENGLTGVESVDRWLGAVNPGQRRAPSRVYSVDGLEPIRVR
ncbi:hypothetical protein GFY24_00775 [Nocardia sp. SYP-A9097]|uniref:hypothetical protein n=1 Tax=Nocardia sp. SYP-A9097 TaxID=2663237 RepID=UPI00129A80AE|nr:hypothetical protein [Nocardia sp. SYP-A9097]MRH86011.1 hypothetical protein [Nocardia sp. SYP-A9097]